MQPMQAVTRLLEIGLPLETGRHAVPVLVTAPVSVVGFDTLTPSKRYLPSGEHTLEVD